MLEQQHRLLHLENFPDGLHQAGAKILLKEFELAEADAQRQEIERQRQDDQAWAAARSERTIAAVDDYITNWPGGLHIDDAHSLRRLLSDEINARGMSVHSFAMAIGVPASRMDRVVKQKRAVTPDTALRLAAYLGGEPIVWLASRGS